MLDIAYRIDNRRALDSAFKAEVKSIEEGIDYFDDYDPVIALNDELNLIEDVPEYDYTYDYGRFWHGYLIYLRPLLTFLSYNIILLLTEIVLAILLVIFIIISNKKLGKAISCILLFGIISIRYFESGFSIGISQTTIIMMLASIYLLQKNKEIKDLNLFFLIVGSVTCFFSWMTYTPLTFGMPLMVYYLLHRDEENKFRRFMVLLLFYLIGYGITWASKWILSDFLYHTEFIKNSIQQIILRTSNDGMGLIEKTNFLTTMICNIFYRIDFGIILFSIIFFMACVYYRNFKKSKIKKVFKEDAIFLLIGLIPAVIYLVLPNHSIIHAGSYSNKLLALTDIAISIVAYDFLKSEQNLEKTIDKASKT